MLNNFLFNVEYGTNHVLDINAYDHVLFLIALTLPYLFKDAKRIFMLVSIFTIGHSISLLLASYNVVRINSNLVEFLIPVTIFIMAVFNVFTAGKTTRKTRTGVLFTTTLFFGLVHGLGFAREFKLFADDTQNKFITLLEFSLGIEIAQIIVVFIVLFLGYITQTVFRFSNRDWVMVVSAIVIGVIIPMLLRSPFLS